MGKNLMAFAIRLVMALVGAVVFYELGIRYLPALDLGGVAYGLLVAACVVVGIVLGAVSGHFLGAATAKLGRALDRAGSTVTASGLIFTSVGLFVGLAIAGLGSLAVKDLPVVGLYLLPVFFSVIGITLILYVNPLLSFAEKIRAQLAQYIVPTVDNGNNTQTEAQQKASALASDAVVQTDLPQRTAIQQDALMRQIKRERGVYIRHEDQKKPPLSYSFSGYIKHDAFFDSYQVVGSRQDHYLLFPDAPLLDRCGNNINRKGRFNMVNIETRARGEVAGPQIFGAYPYGALEADFWGGLLDGIGLVRLRHAFIYLEWPKTNLLIGKYWHPVFISDCYADTISFNNGVPIEPYAREPQVRITTHFSNITMFFAATSYSSALIDLPNPALTQLNIPFTNLTERNAIMPDLNFQVRADIREHFCGIGFNMRRIVPRLAVDADDAANRLRVRESLISFLTLAYAKLNWEKYSLALKFIFSQNGLVYDMISGYAASCQDPLTQARNYANLQCVSFWMDFVRKGKIEPGLFMGITKNIGAEKQIIPSTVWGLDSQRHDIDYVARVEPRIRWFVDPLIFGFEFELTRAGWGTMNNHGRVDHVTPVTNYRALFAAYFCF